MSKTIITTNPDGWTFTLACGQYLNTKMNIDEVMAFLSHESFMTGKRNISEDALMQIAMNELEE